MTLPRTPTYPAVSAIIPARNEEAVIAACVESLGPQPELAEILVIDDQSTDHTPDEVHSLISHYPNLRLLRTTALPAGWVGKNNAVWTGAQESKGEWLLFTDADAVHEPDSVASGLRIGSVNHAAMVSFSPEQITESWYEKALVPFVYTRLAKHFSFENVNNPAKPDAAANGQYLLIRRDAYDAVGGHARVASDLLEDVALAKLVKGAGYRIWFGSGKGIVRVRMYRTLQTMWDGWKKNLYRLIGGSLESLTLETMDALLPLIVLVMIVAVLRSVVGGHALSATAVGIAVIAWHVQYGVDLRKNNLPGSRVWYGLLGMILYIGVLWASFLSYRKGNLSWKGREYPVGTPDASKR